MDDYSWLSSLFGGDYLSADAFYPDTPDLGYDYAGSYWDPAWDQYFTDMDFSQGGDYGDFFGDQSNWWDSLFTDGGSANALGSLSSLLFGSGGASSLLGSGGLAGLLTSPLAGLLGGAALGSMDGSQWSQTPALPGAMDEYAKTLSGSYLSPDNPAWKAIQADITQNFQRNVLPAGMSNWYASNMTGPPSSSSGFQNRMDTINTQFAKDTTNAYLSGVYNPERTRMASYGLAGLPQNYSTNPLAGALGGGLAGLQAMKLFNDLS